MKKFWKKIVSASLIASMCLFGGCGNSKNNSDDSKADDNTGNAQTVSDTDSEDEKIYEKLFSMDSTVKISIDISDDQMQKLQEDYDKYERKDAKSPIYRMCDVKITIDDQEYDIPEVGIRMKGNTSRTDFYNSSEGAYNLIHYRLSFDETFDDEEYYGDNAKVWDDKDARKERKNRTFATLKGLELKWNREVDSTYIRETYAFKMYRDFGLLAPNNTLGQLSINDSSWGVYKIYEPVDKKFIERNFDEEDWGGDLYKCTWGSGPANYTVVAGRAGVDDPDNGKNYTYDLKTNKDTSGNESLQNFVSTITKDSLTKEDVESVVDVDSFVKFMAVSYFLGMPDDMRNNYNNHFIYFKKSTGQAVFIAYDCDLCLGIDQWNPLGNYMTNTNPYSEHAYGNGGDQENNLIRKALCRDGLLMEEYTAALEQVATSKWLTIDNFNEMYNKVAGHYSDVVTPNINFRNLTSSQKSMSVDDTYVENGETKKNSNMTVEEYFSKILENYESRKSES